MSISALLLLTAAWLGYAPGAAHSEANQISVTTVSAASFEPGALAPGAIVAGFGGSLATRVEAATSQPLPITIAGTTVTIRDSAGVDRPAQLFFVSPNQVNYLIPPETATGAATVTVRSGDGATSTGAMQINTAAPAIFTANSNGQGAPAAILLRVKSNGEQTTETAVQFDPAFGRFTPKPIDFGPEGERVFLILFFSGVNRAPDPNSDGNRNESVHLLIGGAESVPFYAGAQGSFAGLDQMNAELPRSLIGRGRLSLSINAPGSVSNLVEIEAGPPAGNAPPSVTGFSVSPVLAGQTLNIQGSDFSTTAANNLARIGGSEARVVTAAANLLSVIVPFGVQGGPVSVRTSQGEGASANPLAVRASISGLVETTSRQPIPGVTLRVVGPNISATTGAEGGFLLPDVPPGIALVEVDSSPVPTSPPYPRISLKVGVLGNRDNQFPSPIALQQPTGPGLQVGSGAFADCGLGIADCGLTDAASGSAFRIPHSTFRIPDGLVQAGGIIFEVPDNATAQFPGGATSGVITLTVVENSRAPVPLPAGQFSSAIAQLTPFGVRLTPGGKLTFPNPDGFPAGARATLFRLDQTRNSSTLGGFIAAGEAVVADDGKSIMTAAGAVTETSYYFVSLARPTTTVVGRVVDSDSVTPVRSALVRSRGQEALTDGAGAFTLRNVPVNAANDNLTVEASFRRPDGRIDRVQRNVVAPIAGGVTQIPLPLVLPAATSNRPPVILAPPSLVVTQGETRDVGVVVNDPDQGQTISTMASVGESFARIIGTTSPRAFILRITPGPNNAGNFTLRITASDNAGGSVTQNVALRVNRPPIANAQTVNVNASAPRAITLTASDGDNDPLRFTIVNQPTGGGLSGAIPNFIYTPKAGFSGRDSFTFKVNDGVVDSATATVAINVERASAVLRTLAYHQITSFTDSVNSSGGGAPKISANGNRIVYTMSPGAGDPKNPNRIFVMNPDGTGQKEVDAYGTLCFCASALDLSNDGSQVISSDTVQLRIASAAAAAGRELVALSSNEISYIRIAGDGSRVFFQTGRDTTLRAAAAQLPIQRGVWVINPDGGGLRQIVGPRQISDLTKVPEAEVFRFDTNGPSLDVSNDGSRIVFGVNARGQRIFAVNLDGGGLRQILGPVNFVSHAGISGNGAKVYYDVIPTPGTAPLPQEIGVINFDGSGRLALTNSASPPPSGFPTTGDRMQLSADGGQLLIGSPGVLYDTTTGAALQLSARFGPLGLLYSGLSRATMNGAANRFIYLFTDNAAILQIVTLDLDPASLGASPSIAAPSLNPLFALINGGSTATVSARLSTNAELILAECVILSNGLFDRNSSSEPLFDNGRFDDAIPDDGIFTYNAVGADCCATPGPRVARINAMARANDGGLHATAVDFAPFFIFAQAPTAPAPVIISFSPPSGISGARLTINGSNFDTTAANNFVLFGARQASVVSATATQLTVIIPAGLAPGAITVTVAANARISNAVNFTVNASSLSSN
ncbi:MAG: Ig-like domain-containing protein [Blastocatellia bacterium]